MTLSIGYMWCSNDYMEARENWEERKGKKTTPEGSQFLNLSHPFMSDNNELCERK